MAATATKAKSASRSGQGTKTGHGGFCGAETRAGGKCRKAAGWGTGHLGVGSCKLHGGSTPNHEVAGQVQLARREAAVMGAPIEDLSPEDALLECIRISGGEVAYASGRIAELDPEHAVGPVVTTRPLKYEKGEDSSTERVHEEGAPAVHIWIAVRHQAMDRLVNYTKVAIAAGLEERRVRIAEQQGAVFAKAVQGILKDLGVADKPEAPGIVRRHLTLVAGGQDARAA